MKKCLRLLVVLFFSMNDMPTMTQSQHLALRWLNLQNQATHTQDEGFGKDIVIRNDQWRVENWWTRF